MDRAFRNAVRRSMSLARPRTSPKVFSASEIRKSFLDYFCEQNNHLFIRSSPVFSLKDGTLAFTNAGMNQFKDVFLGVVRPASNRVANSQKCIRVGGAHNDLEQVGWDGSHHTFFEMLGNWSFGDYFKEEACRLSWNLLTEVYGIPPERLYVTYFKGDDALGLSEDTEVKEIWREIGVKDSHILGFGARDNFWAAGPIGPCGRCTEIHYDHCPGRTDAGHLVNSGTNEVTELWNVVFTEYDRKSNGELTGLNKRFVDTGMGLERLVAVLQGKTSNYDTDLFSPLFEVIREHTGHSGYTGNFEGKADDYGYRVLADHSRMIAVGLSDGMLPNHQNKLRTVIRRTLMVAEKIFNSKADLLKKLATQVAEILSDAFPETGKHLSTVHYIIDTEENTLKLNNEDILRRWNKIKRLYPVISKSDVLNTPQILPCLTYLDSKKESKVVTPEDGLYLSDTLGVPIQVTADVAMKLGFEFDMARYLEYESSWKNSRKYSSHEEYLKQRSAGFSDIHGKLTERKVQPTADYFKHDYRVDSSGKYVFKEQETTIEAIVRGNELVDEVSAGDVEGDEEIGLVLDRTQLFCEEGGQESDRGTLLIENEIVFDITRLARENNFIIHYGRFRDLRRGAKVSVQNLGVIKLDEDRRLAIMRHHTALHLLYAAIQDQLDIVREKVSTVTPEELNLKILVYKKSLHPIDSLKEIEKFVKECILHGASVKKRILNHPQFQALDDVVFIPGEWIVARDIPVIEINSGFKLSRQYCTGTHVLNTSDLKDFVILKHKKGSYGITSITAVAGEGCAGIREVDREFRERWDLLKQKIAKGYLLRPSEIQELLSEINQISSDMNSARTSQITRSTIEDAMKEEKKNLNSFITVSIRNFLQEEIKKASEESSENFIVRRMDCCWKIDPEDLEVAAECFQDKPIFMILQADDMVTFHCIVPANFVTSKFSAKDWLTESVLPVGGLGRFKPLKNPYLTYFASRKKLREDQLSLIMSRAVEMAKRNVEVFL